MRAINTLPVPQNVSVLDGGSTAIANQASAWKIWTRRDICKIIRFEAVALCSSLKREV